MNNELMNTMAKQNSVNVRCKFLCCAVLASFCCADCVAALRPYAAVGPAVPVSVKDALPKVPAEVIGKMQEAGAIVVRRGGRVVGFDFNDSEVTDQQLSALANVRGVTDLSFERKGITDKGIAH